MLNLQTITGLSLMLTMMDGYHVRSLCWPCTSVSRPKLETNSPLSCQQTSFHPPTAVSVPPASTLLDQEEPRLERSWGHLLTVSVPFFIYLILVYFHKKKTITSSLAIIFFVLLLNDICR